MEYLWILLIAAMMLPAFKKKLLGWKRQYSMRQIEKDRDSRLITLVHRQETMSLLGIPLFRYIDMNDSEEVIRAIHMTDPDKPVDMVLHTPGGMVLASIQIARALKEHPGKVTVFVPHVAMSGGTMIALAADEIIMGPHATLGPVDPQINQFPGASISEVVQHKPIGEINDETLIMADMSQKAEQQIRNSVKYLLRDTLEEKEAQQLAKLLSRGTWTHDFPLNHELLQEFGLNVSTEMPEDIYNLMSLYSQPVNQGSGVEYTPMPHTPDNPPTK